jgi:hypothetical protein
MNANGVAKILHILEQISSDMTLREQLNWSHSTPFSIPVPDTIK